MRQNKHPVEAAPPAADAWYRQPVLWLGVAILVASLAGCVWMIVVGARHADVPLEMAERPHTLLDMPVHRADRARDKASGKAPPASRAPAEAPVQRP